MNPPNSYPQQQQPNEWNSSTDLLPDNTNNLPMSQHQFQIGSSPQEKLSGEQIEWLIKRLSTDDQQELGKILRNCTTEMTMTRGLPFAALVTGSMYFARSRLPESLRFGPKRWPFYGLIAVGAITAANVLSMNNCGERVKPKLWELYQKYSANQPNQTTTYESLRAANRQHGAQPMIPSYAPPTTATPMGQEPSMIDNQRAYGTPTPPKSGYLYEDVPTISGTPYSGSIPPVNPGEHERSPRGGNSYGDKGFS